MVSRKDLHSVARLIIEKAYSAKAGHIGGSLSLAPLLMSVIEKNSIEIDTEYIISKGHAALGLYSVLKYLRINEEPYDSFCEDMSMYHGHVIKACGFTKASTGSLGHGVPIACGLAYDKFAKNKAGKVICFVGDGEMQEGSVLETMQFISSYPDLELKIIIDFNGFKDSTCGDSYYLDNVRSSMGRLFKGRCHIIDINGKEGLDQLGLKQCKKGLQLIICKIKKGFGSHILENDVGRWHAGLPSDTKEIRKIIKSLDYCNFK